MLFYLYDRLINNTTMPLDGPARIFRFRLFKLGEPLDPVRFNSMYGRYHDKKYYYFLHCMEASQLLNSTLSKVPAEKLIYIIFMDLFLTGYFLNSSIVRVWFGLIFKN